jgi:hypothetical protein
MPTHADTLPSMPTKPPKKSAGWGGARTPGPGKKLGAPKGPRLEVAPTVYLALRVPEHILGPFRGRYGRGAAKRIYELMEADNVERLGKK